MSSGAVSPGLLASMFGVAVGAARRLAEARPRIVQTDNALAVLVRTGAGTVVSRPSYGADRIVLVGFPVSGDLAVIQADGSHTDHAGDGVFYLTNWQGYRWSSDTGAEVVFLALPVEVLRDFGVTIVDVGRRLASDSAILRPIKAFITELTTEPSELGALSSYLIEKILHEMASALFLETQGNPVTRAASPRSLHLEALAYIAARRADASLDSNAIAADLNVSLRQLQRIFEQNGTTLAGELRRQRVELAATLLRDRAYDVLSIDEIARYSGFGSAAALRRAFQSVHGTAPRRARSAARDQLGRSPRPDHAFRDAERTIHDVKHTGAVSRNPALLD